MYRTLNYKEYCVEFTSTFNQNEIFREEIQQMKEVAIEEVCKVRTGFREFSKGKIYKNENFPSY